MNITINGEQVQLEKPVTITELLSVRNVSMPDMVSVELNGKILDRKDFDTIRIQEGDTIEFLYFMGGGSIGF